MATPSPDTAVDAWGEAGPEPAGRSRLLEWFSLPRDRRGIVLLCGYAALAAFGLVIVLTPPADPLGWAYLLIALVGYFFLQTRGLSTFLWLLVAAAGLLSAVAGGAAGWVQFGIAATLAAAALVPTRRLPPPAVKPAVAIDVSQTETPADVAAADSTPTAAASHGHTFLRALGQLQIIDSTGVDVAAVLENHPVLAFLFKYLLARAVIGEAQISRAAIGGELSPTAPESARLKRLRKQLYLLTHDLPEPVTKLVRTNRSFVWVALDSVESDVGQLSRLCSRVVERGHLLNAELAQEVRTVLSDTDGDFLVGFEDLEQHVNEGRGTAGEMVRQARLRITEQRITLIHALADYEDAMGRPEASIAQLESARQAMPERQDIVRMLVTAYLKTGQTTRASELRREFSLKE